ncbi:MAG: hypothetical protein ABSC72_12545 [Methylovirgula sp.]
MIEARERLGGIVEVDETFAGGLAKKPTQGSPAPFSERTTSLLAPSRMCAPKSLCDNEISGIGRWAGAIKEEVSERRARKPKTKQAEYESSIKTGLKAQICAVSEREPGAGIRAIRERSNPKTGYSSCAPGRFPVIEATGERRILKE